MFVASADLFGAGRFQDSIALLTRKVRSATISVSGNFVARPFWCCTWMEDQHGKEQATTYEPRQRLPTRLRCRRRAPLLRSGPRHYVYLDRAEWTSRSIPVWPRLEQSW